MEITGILLLVGLLVAFIVFLVLLVKAARTWGGLQVTSLVFIFLSTLVFLFAAGGVAKRRVGWVKVHDKKKVQLEDLVKQEQALKNGDLTSTKETDEALLPVLGKLTRLTMDRGRVWRGAQVLDVKPDGVSVRVQQAASPGGVNPPVNANPAGAPVAGAPVAGAPGAPPVAPSPSDQPGAAAPPAAGPAEGTLPAKLVVYVFGETPDATGRFLPTLYLGEYLVDESQGADAKLKPVQQLLPDQLAVINSGQISRWTIYELMPLDSHEAFAAEGSEPTPDELFGRMDPDAISQLLRTGKETLDANPPLVVAGKVDFNLRKGSVLRSYLLDGQQAPDGTPPEATWVLLQFTKEHTIDVDSKEQRSSTDGGYYDLSGRSVDARLKRGGEEAEVKFKPGDKRVFGFDAAQDLIRLGVAEAVKSIYVRPLNNYEYAFRDSRQRTIESIQQLSVLTREKGLLDDTNQKGQAQLTSKQVERRKLDLDLAQVQKEQAVILAESKRLQAELDALTTSIASSYQKLKDLHSTMVSVQSGGVIPGPNP